MNVARWKGQKRKKTRLSLEKACWSSGSSRSSSSSSSISSGFDESEKFRQKTLKKAAAVHTKQINARKLAVRNAARIAFAEDDRILKKYVNEESKFEYDKRKVI